MFVQDNGLKITFALAALLVFAALRSLLQWGWIDTLAVRLVPVIPLLLTGLFFVFGQRTQRENRWASFAYHGTACATLAFDVLAVNRYWLPAPLALRPILLLAALAFTGGAGLLLARRREIPCLHLLQTGLLLTGYLALQNAMTNRPDNFLPFPLRPYGVLCLSLAAFALWQSVRTGRKSAEPDANAWSAAWQFWMHSDTALLVVLAAAASLRPDAGRFTEWAAFALIAGVLYGAGAQGLRSPDMARIAGLFVAASGILFLAASERLALPGAAMLLLALSFGTAALWAWNRGTEESAELAAAWRQMAIAGLLGAMGISWALAGQCAVSMPAQMPTAALLALQCG